MLNIPMPSSQATSINDEGTIVGFEQTSPAATTASGYVIKDGRLTEINFPGASFTQALGINDRGEIVGAYNDANGNTQGFVYKDGRFQQVEVPGATSTTVNGVNNNGRIVGFFVDPNNNTIGLVGEEKS